MTFDSVGAKLFGQTNFICEGRDVQLSFMVEL